jgi:hypothetical protein
MSQKRLKVPFGGSLWPRSRRRCFPMLAAPHHGVSDDAMDLIHGGFISGGVDLIAMQNQAPPPPQFGLTGQQQAALSFAWLVLQRLQQRGTTVGVRAVEMAKADASASAGARFCTVCGLRSRPGAKFLRGLPRSAMRCTSSAACGQSRSLPCLPSLQLNRPGPAPGVPADAAN